MPYELQIRHLSRAGIVKNGAIIPLSASFTITKDKTNPLRFWLNSQNDALDTVEEFDIMQVLIRNLDIGLQTAGGGFINFFDGIVRAKPNSGGIFRRVVDDDGIENVQLFCPHIRHILEWRTVGYPSEVLNRSKFVATPAETIAKTIVDYNCNELATVANGRHREGDLASGMLIDIDMQADGGGGNVLTRSYSNMTVLAALQKINQIGGGYFTFTYDLGTWSFGWKNGLLGDDKTSGAGRVLFSLDNMTITNPSLENVPAVGTVAIVGGSGQESTRLYQVVEGPQYAATNDIETFVSVTNLKELDSLIAAGNENLDDRRGKSILEHKVNQTQDIFYSPIDIAGKQTYKVGDSVVSDFGGVFTKEVVAASFNWRASTSGDALSIDVDTEDIFL